MAYLQVLQTKCDGRLGACAKRATHQLIDRWNGKKGLYCRACGEKELKRQTAAENQYGDQLR